MGLEHGEDDPQEARHQDLCVFALPLRRFDIAADERPYAVVEGVLFVFLHVRVL
jgi:hypothetical protein